MEAEAEKHGVNAPDDNGLLINLDSAGTAWMRFIPDAHLRRIHPNIHVPSTLEQPRELGGGGSGVTIVRGVDQRFGDVVIKHGGHKDTAELFALATVHEQLRVRARDLQADTAAEAMRRRVPIFEFMYISQAHLREVSQAASSGGFDSPPSQSCGAEIVRSKSMKMKARKTSKDTAPKRQQAKSQTLKKVLMRQLTAPAVRRHAVPAEVEIAESDEEEEQLETAISKSNVGVPTITREQRSISVSSPAKADITVGDDCLAFRIGGQGKMCSNENGNYELQCSLPGQGYSTFAPLIKSLSSFQKVHSWKFTLAQKTIGGANPTTASAVLANRKLVDDRLRTLVGEILKVIRDLQRLTRPSEREAVRDLQKEIRRLLDSGHPEPSDVSDAADAFVGKAILKNYDRHSGRFPQMRGMGCLFRSEIFDLPPEEQVPGRFLGVLLQRGAKMQEVFVTDLVGQTAFDALFCGPTWLRVLELAFNLQCSAAVSPVWTCGITDGGLHNLFLGEDAIWLFDLGEPSLMPMPAFLTKLFMSFFHALGMEEDDKGGWLNRFKPCAQDGLLQLTPESEALLQEAHDAFKATLGRFMKDVFNSEAAVCELIVMYVVLQLLSDAAFCLQRWENKGGGVDKDRRGRARPLEKWLWRTLWDLYVAAYVLRQDWCKEVGCERSTVGALKLRLRECDCLAGVVDRICRR